MAIHVYACIQIQSPKYVTRMVMEIPSFSYDFLNSEGLAAETIPLGGGPGSLEPDTYIQYMHIYVCVYTYILGSHRRLTAPA